MEIVQMYQGRNYQHWIWELSSFQSWRRNSERDWDSNHLQRLQNRNSLEHAWVRAAPILHPKQGGDHKSPRWRPRQAALRQDQIQSGWSWDKILPCDGLWATYSLLQQQASDPPRRVTHKHVVQRHAMVFRPDQSNWGEDNLSCKGDIWKEYSDVP